MEEERWVIGPDRGGLGTFWWRTGDLDADLQGKKFKNDEWFDGEEGDDDNAQMVESEGANGFGLTMEIENQAEVIFEWRVRVVLHCSLMALQRTQDRVLLHEGIRT